MSDTLLDRQRSMEYGARSKRHRYLVSGPLISHESRLVCSWPRVEDRRAGEGREELEESREDWSPRTGSPSQD